MFSQNSPINITVIVIADILSQDSGECVICLDDLLAGKLVLRNFKIFHDATGHTLISVTDIL